MLLPLDGRMLRRRSVARWWPPFVVIAVLVAALTASPLPLAAQDSPTITFVSSLPRTGRANAQTDAIVNSIRMALDDVSYKEAGFQVVYEDLDDATPARGTWDPAKEAENANLALNDPDVMIYLGPFNSGAAAVSIPILNPVNLVMISPATTYPGLTKPGAGATGEPDVYYPNGVRNFARVVPTDDVQGAVAAAWAKQLGAHNVYVLDDTELYGHGIARVFADTARSIGLDVVGGPDGIDAKAADYRAEAQKIHGSGADLVYFGGTTQSNAGKLWLDLRTAMPNVLLMGPDGILEDAFVQAAGEASEGTFVTFGGRTPASYTGAALDWLQRYRHQFGADPPVYAIYGYEATRVALDAIQRAGVKDRASIRDAVFATRDFDGALGTWSFDANGDTSLSTMTIQQIVAGKFQPVHEVSAP
jgi:branched-chain amino acid transport system substrate-binding protein